MGRSNISGVLNDFFKDERTILGSIPFMGEKEGLRQLVPLTLHLMVRVWPTMKVADRIKSMTVSLLKWRLLVKRWLFDVGNRNHYLIPKEFDQDTMTSMIPLKIIN
jgi:hypothetical protein